MRHRLRQQVAIAKLITDDLFEVIETFQGGDSSKTPNAASELTKRSA
jgi:hypothetical protein